MMSATSATSIDPVLLAVLANRFETIVREMTNTLQRAAYSPIISVARDFSCSIVTSSNDLLAAAEGVPVHVYGSNLQAASMVRLHPDLAEGDAYLHNDVYLGNSHAADHSILVPVFVDGEHMCTTNAKGHLADIGNSMPTTYMPGARDVYEEGALVFPCVRIQRSNRDVEDIIRICRSRIRVPDQWYGDYLAMLGSARVGERRLSELVAKYGKETIRQFIREWFDYSERRMIHALERLPSGQLTGSGRHDPFPPGLPDGIPLSVSINVDSENRTIEVDLRDNVDCVPAGINESEACAVASVIQGIFSVIDPDIPHNAGSFRRIKVLVRENSVAGIPSFPHSCSLATTNPSNRLINLAQSTFAQIGDGWGLAEGGTGHNVGYGVISGIDRRRGNAPYVTQLVLANNGGPASPVCDGWVTYSMPAASGLLYRDSVEIDEQRFPIVVKSLRVAPDLGGPGRLRGAPPAEVVFGPREDPVMVYPPSAEGHMTPAKGVVGGHDGNVARMSKIERSGVETRLPGTFFGEIKPGEWIKGTDCGGGGYGDPLERDPKKVLWDVRERWVSQEQARDTYGVVLKGSVDADALALDQPATDQLRKRLRKSS